MTLPYPTYPIGLDYVINAISPPHQVKSIDMNDLKDRENLAVIVNDYSPEVIGISIRNIDNVDDTHTETFIEKIRGLIDTVRRHSKAIIVLGGSGFTILPGEFMAGLDADYGVIGEGERFPMLLHALEKKEPASGIPGVVTGSGPVVFPEPLSESFERGNIPDHSYRSFYLERGGMLNLQTKRGCPFRCIYCTYPHIEGSRFRFTEPEKVAHTARMLQDAGAKYLYLTDSTFNGNYAHSLAVALAFKKVGLSIPWGGFFTPTIPPPDYYRQLADAGLKHVEFGSEALCNSMLAAYRKPFCLDDVLASHRLAGDAGLHVAHYLMLGGPGETERTLQSTLSNGGQLEKTVIFVFCGVRIYPHTDLYETALNEKQVARNKNLLEPTFYWSSALDRENVIDLLMAHAAKHTNWVIGSGPPGMYKLMAKLHARGRVGPLWENLIR